MILFKVLINYEMAAYIMVAAETAEQAEEKANEAIDAPGWNPKSAKEHDYVDGTCVILPGNADPVGEVVA